MCLQETKAHLDQLPAALKDIEGYHSFFSTPERKGYSGVGLYTKTKPESVSFGLAVEEYDKEGRVLVADYGRFVLINIYFPNGQSSGERLQYKMEFYDHFLEFVEKIKASGKGIVLCGDLNTAHTEIDLARPEPNKGTSGFLPIEREWMDKFISHGYKDTFRMFNQEPENYTYWDQMTRARDRNVGWRIDYFFVDDAFSAQVTNAYILADVMGSDQHPTKIVLKYPPSGPKINLPPPASTCFRAPTLTGAMSASPARSAATRVASSGTDRKSKKVKFTLLSSYRPLAGWK